MTHDLRRAPRQQRSQVLFDKILGTAKKLFAEEGYAYISTNHIADAANLSIGSIYHYFPNCESIALAIYEKASVKATMEIKQSGFGILDKPINEAMPIIFKATIKIFKADQYALLQMIDEVPELRQAAQMISFDNLIQKSMRTYLEQYFPDADLKEIGRKAYMVQRCIVATIRTYLHERPGNLSEHALVMELTTMMQPYVATLAKKSMPSSGSK